MNNQNDEPPDTYLSWNAPQIQVPSDSRDKSGRRARYRLLQSWYREKVLLLPRYGKSQRGHPVGSMLHEHDVDANPDLNLMSEAANYAHQRVADVKAAGGSADDYRLEHNMLSSMPLCFSIFGTLRGLPDRGLDLVHALFDDKAVEVSWIECEWKPELNLLGDRTAFDAALMVRHEKGFRHLIGVETKYTEPFSQREYLTPRYLEVHRNSGWFRKEVITRVAPKPSNQLWRNTLLAATCEHRVDVDRASVVVLALDRDAGAGEALRALSLGLRKDQQTRCRSVSLETLVAAIDTGLGPGRDWAERFHARYLDLSPVADMTASLAGGE